MGQRLSVLAAPRHEGLPRATPAGLPLPFDRDLSLIEFYRRVFDEACDTANPLLERVKFLGIVGTILHEFAITRYAELARAAHLKRIETDVKDLLAAARLYLREEIAPALAGEGIHLLGCADLQPKERAEVEAYFTESVLPLVIPLGFDAARPFPHVTGRTIALAVIVRHGGQEHFACVQVPDALPALVPFHWRRPHARCAALEQGFVWLHDVVSEHLAAVFPGSEIVQTHPFRVFRDASLDAELPEGVTVPDAVAQGLHRREYGEVLALVAEEKMPRWLLELLSKNLGIAPGAAHICSDLTDLKGLAELSRLDRPDLHGPPLVPRAGFGETADIFASIRQGDMLLHYPYESFQPVIDFIEKAASDPDVLAISTTLYRVGRNSPIVDALRRARRAGKQVRVVIELRARFDEENNLAWGRALQEAGAHVVYGTIGLKVHAKLTLIVRREAGNIRRYVHLSSGNYNPVTSSVYTDLGLLTCREDIASDATQLFNVLTGYASLSTFLALVVASLALRHRVHDLIEREASWARQGHAAHMILKMNSLSD
ncbi:MAG: polyphosphate kinase 1 [Acidobacteria bacterium]|nr:polyphosphate kinase 1 [Acidobacteriota bacterium]